MKTDRRTFKERAHALIDELPDYATWYDLITKAEEQYGIEGNLVLEKLAQDEQGAREL